jgi:hypothetical protein
MGVFCIAYKHLNMYTLDADKLCVKLTEKISANYDHHVLMAHHPLLLASIQVSIPFSPFKPYSYIYILIFFS